MHYNYPNPFSAFTTAPFTLEEEEEIMVLVYDVGGRRILQQDLGVRPAGFHTHELELSGVPSGTYVYEIVLNNSWRQQNTITVVK